MYWHKCSKSVCTEKNADVTDCVSARTTTEAENVKIELEFWKQNWQKAGLKILKQGPQRRSNKMPLTWVALTSENSATKEVVEENTR